MEEESGLALGALDEAVGGQQLFHHPGLPDPDPWAVSKGSVAIVVKQAGIKAHLFKGGKRKKAEALDIGCWTMLESLVI